MCKRMRSKLAAFLLSVGPVCGLIKMSQVLEATYLVTYLFSVAGITVFLYRADKRQAERGKRRTPESMLHLLECIGGWQAAFVAQKIFRHKVSKRAYQIRFWSIALIHNYLAFDYLSNWQETERAVEAIAPLLR